MIEILLIAVALAMDCFTVSVVSGVIVRKREAPLMLSMAFLFGFFQALMPLLGWLLTSRFSEQIQAWDHWIAFAMLAFIGGKMILDAFKKEEDPGFDPRSPRTQVALAVATSIDALAIGITFACTGYESLRQLWWPLGAIGLVSFLFSLGGFSLGVRSGEAVRRRVRPEILGGVILIGIGIKILVEHLC